MNLLLNVIYWAVGLAGLGLAALLINAALGQGDDEYEDLEGL